MPEAAQKNAEHLLGTGGDGMGQSTGLDQERADLTGIEWEYVNGPDKQPALVAAIKGDKLKGTAASKSKESWTCGQGLGP